MAKKSHLKQILLQLDPGKPREKEVILTLERLKSKGISHKAAVIEALTLFATKPDRYMEALTQKSELILDYLQEMKYLFLQGGKLPRPTETRFETIELSEEVLTEDEIDNF